MFCRGLFALFLSLGIISSPREKQPQQARALYPVSLISPGQVSYPTTPARAGFVLDVSDDPNGESEGDDMILKVLRNSRSEQPLAQLKFASTYGFFDLTLVDVTGDGIEAFFLVTGENLGTNVRQERLTVWTRSGKSFRKLLRVPVSAYCGMFCHWEYERQFVDVNEDGIIDLRLVLKVEPGKHADRSLIPKETVREYTYDKQAQKLVRFKIK